MKHEEANARDPTLMLLYPAVFAVKHADGCTLHRGAGSRGGSRGPRRAHSIVRPSRHSTTVLVLHASDGASLKQNPACAVVIENDLGAPPPALAGSRAGGR